MSNIDNNCKNILIFIPEIVNDTIAFRYSLERELIRQFLEINKLNVENKLFKQLQISSYQNHSNDVVNNTINTIDSKNIGIIISYNNTVKDKVSPLIVWDSYEHCVDNIIDETRFTKYYDIIIEICKYENSCDKIYINKIK